MAAGAGVARRQAAAAPAGRAPSAAPLPPPPLPPPPLPAVEEPPDFDALLALSAAEQSAPSLGSPPPLPPPMTGPPMMPPPPMRARRLRPALRAPAAPALPVGYLPRPRRERSNMAVGIDNVTPWFILLFLGAKAFDVIRSMMALADVPEEVKHQLKIGPGAFITAACVDVLVFFAVAATLVWLAVFIASKIMKFPLPDSAYLKAAGVAAIPSVVVTLIQILPLNLVIDAGLILAIIPVTLWVLKFAFDMTWPEALVAYAFVLPLYVVGWIIRMLDHRRGDARVRLFGTRPLPRQDPGAVGGVRRFRQFGHSNVLE